MGENEKKLCEIVTRLFEEKLGVKRANVTYPEKDTSSPPDERVEIRFDLAERGYVIEHTRVEPFEGEITAAVHFAAFERPIRDALHGKLPAPGFYRLVFPMTATAGRPVGTHDKLRSAIIDWVSAAAKELHVARLGREDGQMALGGRGGVRSTTINGMSLTLSGPFELPQNNPSSGSLSIHRHDEDVAPLLEESRRARIGRALRCKLPKLSKWAKSGNVTILILENADICLSDHSRVAGAVKAELLAQDFRPDYIFIADTAAGDTWELQCPVQDETLFLDMEYVAKPLP